MDECSDENLKHLPKSLFDRHVELQRQLDKQKEEKLDCSNIQTQISYFFETFDAKMKEINIIVDKLTNGSIENERLPDCFDKLTKDIQLLNRHLSTSSSFLRVYNIRKCKQTLEEITAKCKVLEDELLPRKKFGFKSKRNKVIDQTSDKSSNKKIFSDDRLDGKINVKNNKWKQKIETYGFHHRTGECLKLNSEELEGKDIELSDITDCTIILTGSPNTLHLASIDKSRIFCGPVSTSVFVEDCKNCLLVFPCQQLRVHHTNKTNIYIHVTSRTIIEDSQQIQVAPFNWNYDNIEEHFKLSGLDPNRNNWDSVDDFNWLAQDKPSPNWNVMDESERVVDWNLDDVKN